MSRDELHIEDLTTAESLDIELKGTVRGLRADYFEGHYLSAGHAEVFGEVDEEGVVLIPPTLSEVERQVVALLYLDFTQKETAVLLKLRRNEMEQRRTIVQSGARR